MCLIGQLSQVEWSVHPNEGSFLFDLLPLEVSRHADSFYCCCSSYVCLRFQLFVLLEKCELYSFIQ